jgi:hypothetical protein
MATWRPYKCTHNSTAGVDYSTAPENFPHDASRASDKHHKTHTLTHVVGKFPTPQRCTSHTWPNHPERVRIFYFLGEFPNRQTNNNNSIVLCPFNLVHHQLICSLWHIRINTHTPNGILWRNNKNRHENRTDERPIYTRTLLCLSDRHRLKRPLLHRRCPAHQQF